MGLQGGTYSFESWLADDLSIPGFFFTNFFSWRLDSVLLCMEDLYVNATVAIYPIAHYFGMWHALRRFSAFIHHLQLSLLQFSGAVALVAGVSLVKSILNARIDDPYVFKVTSLHDAAMLTMFQARTCVRINARTYVRLSLSSQL